VLFVVGSSDTLFIGCSLVADTANLGVVGEAMQYNEPDIYASNVPAALANTVPSIAAAIRGQRISDVRAVVVVLLLSSSSRLRQAGTMAKDITTTGGQTFTVFAKNGAWNQELYEDLVAPALGSDLRCETWIRSPPLPSFCPPQYKCARATSTRRGV
jgi:hypothetical protein